MIAHLILVLAAQTANAQTATCIPGAQLACACLGGSQGIQVCERDGRSLGACACPDSDLTPGSEPRGSVSLPKITHVQEVGPRELPYNGVVRPGYTLDTRARSDWIEGGLGAAASLYLAGGLVASLIDAEGSRKTTHRWLYLPVAGPLVAALNPEDGKADTFTFILVIDALIQAAGVGAALYGLASPEEYLLRDDLVIAPMVNDETIGVGLRGRL